MLAAWLYPMMCYGFVLLSSAAGAGAGSGESDATFTPGGSWNYELMTTVLLNEPSATDKDVGFQIAANVKVDSVWRNPTRIGDRLLQIEVCLFLLFECVYCFRICCFHGSVRK